MDYTIKGRPKSIFSIRRKMQKQGVSFDEVYDKFAIRIIYKGDEENEKFFAWKIYSIVTDHFRPNPMYAFAIGFHHQKEQVTKHCI